LPFIDETQLTVSAGNGGPGVATFRREKYVPRGGPDGGDGGDGGDVIFIVKQNLKTLSHLAFGGDLSAENGKPGAKKKMHGRNGAPVYIEVPPGTLVRDADSGELIKDLSLDEEWIFLRGGKGGRGNVWFKSSTRQAPRYAQSGLPGMSANIIVELNLIADIGLVGLPNAGKSTLLDVLTNAHPEIAAYPFTTKTPNLGVLKAGYDEIVLADTPGIIDGAADGVGLGHKFLKHISRTKAIAFVVDLSGEDPVADYRTVTGELEQFDKSLLLKPRIIIGSKTDLESAVDGGEALISCVGETVHFVSSHSLEGIDELIGIIQAVYRGE
jgi:GTPase